MQLSSVNPIDLDRRYRVSPERSDELARKIRYVEMLNRTERIFDDRTSWTNLEYRVFWSRGCLREYIVLSNDCGVSARRSEGNSLHAILRELGKIIDGGYYAEEKEYVDLLKDKEWELDRDGRAKA